MQPALEERKGPHLDFAELKIFFSRRKQDAASEDMAEGMTVNSLQRKNSWLDSASAIADGKISAWVAQWAQQNHKRQREEIWTVQSITEQHQLLLFPFNYTLLPKFISNYLKMSLYS